MVEAEAHQFADRFRSAHAIQLTGRVRAYPDEQVAEADVDGPADLRPPWAALVLGRANNFFAALPWPLRSSQSSACATRREQPGRVERPRHTSRTRPSRSRRVRRPPYEDHSHRAGTPRIVRAGPSSLNGASHPAARDAPAARR